MQVKYKNYLRLTVAIILFVCIFALFSVGCIPGAGMSDWTYSFSDNYALWHIHKDLVVLHVEERCYDSRNEKTNTPVATNILAYAIYENFLLIQCVSDKDINFQEYHLFNMDENVLIKVFDDKDDAEKLYLAYTGLKNITWNSVADMDDNEKAYGMN